VKYSRNVAVRRDTVSFCDAEGHRLLIRRIARMPEERKATLKTMLSEEIAIALRQRPDLTPVCSARIKLFEHLVKFADGACGGIEAVIARLRHPLVERSFLFSINLSRRGCY
jgi:hypothetical protein